METPLLIIINGAPGSGKTTLARKLAEALNLPLFCKDDLKETLFEVLGWQDRAWSQKLGHASIMLLYQVIACQLRAGGSLIAETAFIPQYDTARFLALKANYSFEPFQILCQADEQTLIERFMKRATSDERHPGHVDHLITEVQIREALRSGKYGPLEIGGPLYELDTTDFGGMDYERLLRTIEVILANKTL